MSSGPETILRTLDRHLTGPGEIRLFGGAALVLGYGRNRTTEDADLLMDDRECHALIEDAGFGEAIEAVNAELEPQGLYLSHIFGPEQQVLSPSWRASCRAIALPGLRLLSVTCLGPVDLVLTKMGRGDDEDFADVRFLFESRAVDAAAVRHALAEAIVPAEYAELFASARPKLTHLLDQFGAPNP
jgi:hypothetical protein